MHIQNNLTDLTNVSTIENADFAFYDWMDLDLNLFCTQQDGLKKAPILWVSPERAYQIKSDREFRDATGAINPPVISVERTSITKDVKDNGTYYANIPPLNNRHRVSRKINQKKTSEFANADAAKSSSSTVFLGKKRQNKKIVYEYSDMLLPVYAMFTYKISILTQYQQQMNELLQPFLTRTGSTKYFLIERDGYKYESFIDGQISSRNATADMATEERKYISEITIKVLVNLLSDGVNERTKVIKTYENPVELKLNKDRVSINSRNTQNQSTIFTSISSGGSFGAPPTSVGNREFIFRVGPSNTTGDTTTLQHGLNNTTISVIKYEYENSEIVAYIESVDDLRFYPDYLEIDGLEYGTQYLFIITG